MQFITREIIFRNVTQGVVACMPTVLADTHDQNQNLSPLLLGLDGLIAYKRPPW